MLCDANYYSNLIRMLPIRLKGKFYLVVFKYGTECWFVKKIYEQKMEVQETWMLRWMYSCTMMDRIRNWEFRDMLGVAPFIHKRKVIDAPVRRIESIIVEDKGSQRRTKKLGMNKLKKDLSELPLSRDLTRDTNS